MANFTLTNSTYSGFGGTQQSLGSSLRSIIVVGAGTSVVGAGAPSGGAASPYNPRRGKIYDILVGTNTTPADNVIYWIMQRANAMGSSIAWTGALSSISSNIALDTADGIIQAFAIVNSTNDGAAAIVVAQDVWSVGINQRASYRWVSAPGSEFVYPATSSAGFLLRAQSPAYVSTLTGTALFQEQ